MTNGLRHSLAAFGVVTALVAPAFANEPALRYRAAVDLTGTVVSRMISMDPSSRSPDVRTEKRYFLRLDQPISVTDGEKGDKTLNPDEKSIGELQLFSKLPPDNAVELALQQVSDKGAKVILKGGLVHSSTKEHATKVLLEVGLVTLLKSDPVPAERPVAPPGTPDAAAAPVQEAPSGNALINR